MRKSNIILACVFCVAGGAWAKTDFLRNAEEYYPGIIDTKLDDCTLCHTDPPARNDYGRAYKNASRDFGAIEDLDSDGDGVLNGDEIADLTFPGDGTDFLGISEGEVTEGEPTGGGTEGEGEGEASTGGAEGEAGGTEDDSIDDDDAADDDGGEDDDDNDNDIGHGTDDEGSDEGESASDDYGNFDTGCPVVTGGTISGPGQHGGDGLIMLSIVLALMAWGVRGRKQASIVQVQPLL